METITGVHVWGIRYGNYTKQGIALPEARVANYRQQCMQLPEQAKGHELVRKMAALVTTALWQPH